MRQIILLALFTVLYTVRSGAQETQTQTQDTLYYKSFAEFNSDTIRFLEYNFTTRGKQYEGRKVSEVIKDMEFAITHVVEIGVMIPPNEKSKLSSLSLGIWQAGDKPNPIVDYYVEIWFKNCPLMDDLKRVFNTRDPDRKFTPELYDFIKDLEISGLKANPYIILK